MADPIGVFSGLSSGIDWRSMVDQIIQVESRPIYNYEVQISDHEIRRDAWESFRSMTKKLEASAASLADGSAFKVFTTSTKSISSSSGNPVGATATAEASPGTYTAKVLQLASREKLGSDVYSSRTAALGVSGEFLMNGVAIQVEATDSLDDLVSDINKANTGTTAPGVTASVLTKNPGQFNLVLTSDDSGVAGINLVDGSAGVLKSLGFLDSTLEVKNQISAGVASDDLISSSQAVGTLLGLTATPASAAVTMGVGAAQFNVTIDLAADSLAAIATAINTAASGAGSSVTASAETVTDADGNTAFRLEIEGTTTFTDANGILETLGVLRGGRGDVTQELTSETAFTDGDASTTATASTLLTNLWLGGATGGVAASDTLSLSGTRGDGTTFTKTFTVGASDTLQDLLDDINDATDGLGYGTRTATASIGAAGNLVVTDGTGGDSRLALSIVTNNEGGGVLDFGDIATTETGRARELVAGVDAQVEVDGTFIERSSNAITDLIPGVNFTLYSVDDAVATIEVSRNTSAIATSITDFVGGYNGLVSWVTDQFSGVGADEDVSQKPLSGDGVLREMRNSLRTSMQTELAAAVGGDMTRLFHVGIEVDQEGYYQVDAAKLKSAVESDSAAVTRLFGLYGSGSISTLNYVDSGSGTTAGNYAIELTQAASQAATTSVGFSGTYSDDATADTMTIRDVGTDSEYSISLANGMTLAQIVSGLNSEFNTAAIHQAQATEGMYSDAIGTAATNSTLLQDLFDSGGTSFGVADGDILTISGTESDASAFLVEFVVTDITTQTLGDLRSAVASAAGSGETVTWEGGLLTVTGQEAGRSSLSLAVTSDNTGGGTLSFGTVDTITAGRGAVDIAASDSGGQLALAHSDYGTGAGFEISFTGGGTDNTASLGVTASTYSGDDIIGTIGGFAATGTGQILVGDEDTDVEGLMLSYAGADTGTIGDFTFSRGIGSALELMADIILGTEGGSIDAVLDNFDPNIKRINDRIETLESRLERRRAELVKRFTALEEAMTMAQQQSNWIGAQFSAMAAKTSSK